jgi:hypothetical protein
MAHFAEIDAQGTVLRVIVVHNNELMDSGNESEPKGIAFCQSLFGGNWMQTSYNATFRKNYAGAGFTYDAVRDAFIPPKPFASWVLNEDTCRWDAPVPYPTDGKFYTWDEPTLSWVELVQPE